MKKITALCVSLALNAVTSLSSQAHTNTVAPCEGLLDNSISWSFMLFGENNTRYLAKYKEGDLCLKKAISATEDCFFLMKSALPKVQFTEGKRDYSTGGFQIEIKDPSLFKAFYGELMNAMRENTMGADTGKRHQCVKFFLEGVVTPQVQVSSLSYLEILGQWYEGFLGGVSGLLGVPAETGLEQERC